MQSRLSPTRAWAWEGRGSVMGCTTVCSAVLAAPGHQERHPFCMLLPLQSHKSLGLQRSAQTDSNAHNEVWRYAYTCMATRARSRAGAPQEGPRRPTPRGRCKPPTSRHCSGSPSHQRQERPVLHWSMQGAPKQLRAVQDGISSSAG